MLYHAYQAHSDLMSPIRLLAAIALETLDRPPGLLQQLHAVRGFSAACALLAHTKLTHDRPAFGISPVKSGNRDVEVTETPVMSTPFGTLLRFKKDIDTEQPRVLVVAPLSGHFATLLRSTVATLVQENDVYITDWHNARDVSLAHGGFGFDDYVQHVIRFLEAIGPRAHVVAVCQPCVTALAAVALMAEADHPDQPASLTLMAGPIDTRINPTTVNELATSKPIAWFKRNVITTVPGRYAGGGRRVYPGFLQLTAFMAMNLERHVKAHRDLFGHLRDGDTDKASATRDFYDEYFAVLDLPAEFYLETVQMVFQEHLLPKGELEVSGRRVNPAAIRKTALLTVEGERDDICSIGQTLAAQDLCSSIRPYRKRHHMQAGVGHYGVFSGSRWNGQIYPIVRSVIMANS